jgi:hypothetical protein
MLFGFTNAPGLFTLLIKDFKAVNGDGYNSDLLD